ncbi:MFS transporter [Streptomyces olivaceus]|nr:MFS transporter [Streptomyces olivaceus]MBZ6330908.1 MFS transporter [Streptomyces olivaceus]
MLGMVIDATGSGMYLPLSLLYFHHVTGIPLTQVGAIMTGAALLGLVGNPLTGILIDRYGARAVVVGGYVLRAAGFATYPLVDSAGAMFAVVAVVAFGDVSFSPSIQSFIAEIVHGAARDKLLAAQRSLRNAGLGAGGLIAGGVLALGFGAAFQAIVLSTAAAYLTAAALIRSIPQARATDAVPPARARRGYRLVVRNRPFLLLTAVNVPTAFGYMVLSVSLPVYITQELNTADSLVGVLYATNTVGIALLQIPVTRFLTRYRRTRVAALGGAVFCAAFLSFAALGLISARTPVLIGVFAATLLFTLGELMHGATTSALVASAAPEATRGRHLAVYQLSWAIPTALAPAVLTALLTLSPTGMWLLLAFGIAGSALTLIRLEPRLPERAVRPDPPSPIGPGEPQKSTATGPR